MSATPSASENVAVAGQTATRRFDNLALAFQQILTVIVRLRSNRQYVENAEAFRANVKALLKQATKDATSAGYAMEDVRDATFAVVAFLDESVLSSANPISEDWKRKPLQEEIFAIHMGGEFFFQNLEKLLTRKESAQTADLLEVYALCLLLGYRGRYGGGGSEEWRGYKNRVAAKIREIRGGPRPLSEGWAPTGGGVVLGRSDPWTRRLIWIAGACLLLVVILFAAFKLSLSSGASDLVRMVSAVAHAARRPETMKVTPHPPSYLGHPLPMGEGFLSDTLSLSLGRGWRFREAGEPGEGSFEDC